MANTTKRIINLTELSELTGEEYLIVDHSGNGTNKVSTGVITDLQDDVSKLEGDISDATSILYFDENVSEWDEWEKGMVTLYKNPWGYISTNGAIRNKEGKDIFLNVGMAVGLTDYTTYAYYIGVRRADGTQMWSSGTWLTSETVISRDGYYGIMIHRQDGANMSDAEIATASALVYINHYNTKKDIPFSVFAGYLRADGNIGLDGSNVVTTNLISVSAGEKFLIAEKVPSGSIEIHYCFYSDARTIISSRNTYATTNYTDRNDYKIGYTEITVPSNAKYMRVTFHDFDGGYYHLFKLADANGNNLSSGADVYKDTILNEQDCILFNKAKHNIKASLMLDLSVSPILFNTFTNTMIIPATTTVIANKRYYSVSSSTTLDLSISTHSTTLLVVVFDVSTLSFSVIPYTSYSSIDDNKYIVCTMRWYPYSSDRIKIDLDCPWALNGMMYGITKPNEMIKAVAHRGLSYTAPENTIIAFQLARLWGFEYAETDVMFTSDEIPVLLHDPTINRTARNADGTSLSATINIEDITYTQASEYDFGIYKGSAFVGTAIPKFEDFIITCKRLGLRPIIELKTDANLTQSRITALMTIVKKYGMKKYTSWSSFDSSYLAVIKSLDNEATLIYNSNYALSSADITTLVSLQSGSNTIAYWTAVGVSDSDVESLITNNIELVGTLSDDPTVIASDNLYSTYQVSNGAIVGNVLAGYELQNMEF